MRDLDKFRGCLVAGAAGDALGYEVEFLQEESIFKKFGENGITEYRLRDGVAQISDDTQMTLFTATGLLLGTTRGKMRGIMGGYEGYIHAGPEFFDKLFPLLPFVMLMITCHRSIYFEMIQYLPAVPCILRRYKVGVFKSLHGPEGHIVHISYRRCAKIKCSAHLAVLLKPRQA